MPEDDVIFPVRFRGYDRKAVDHELRELHAALEYAHAERDRAVARALTIESGGHANNSASATVQWLIDTAEQDARQIRAEAERTAAEYTARAEELLRHRVELVEQAQHEAEVCRAQGAQEAREVIQDALEKANALLRGLRDSEQALHEMFGSGALGHRMPPPRTSADDVRTVEVLQPVAQHGAHETPTPTPRAVPSHSAGDTTAPIQQPLPRSTPVDEREHTVP